MRRRTTGRNEKHFPGDPRSLQLNVAFRNLDAASSAERIANDASSSKGNVKRTREEEEEKKNHGLSCTMNYKMFFVEQIFLTFHLSERTRPERSPSLRYRTLPKGLSAQKFPKAVVRTCAKVRAGVTERGEIRAGQPGGSSIWGSSAKGRNKSKLISR